MIADDTDAIRLVLNDILSIGEHEIVGEAIDGLEAVTKFNELKPEVLLLDLAMPKKDGSTVTKEIIRDNPDAKIILITASGKDDVIKTCMDQGASAYISKPFKFDIVLKKISEITS